MTVSMSPHSTAMASTAADHSPRVYCVIPTHNRLGCLRNIVDLLDGQSYPNIEIVIVNDGSVDGTGEFLQSLQRENLRALHGDGSLWWGGAMRAGMAAVAELADADDFLLMLNDDMFFGEDFVLEMVLQSKRVGHGVVGSVQCGAEHNEVLSVGYRVDFFRMQFINVTRNDENRAIDSLPGRGTLVPMIAIRKAGLVNAKLFPHYLGDLEYFSRLRDDGFSLCVAERAAIYTSSTSSDSAVAAVGFFSKYFSSRSKNNIFGKLLYFSLRGPVFLRFWCVPRFPLVKLAGFLKNMFSKDRTL